MPEEYKDYSAQVRNLMCTAMVLTVKTQNMESDLKERQFAMMQKEVQLEALKQNFTKNKKQFLKEIDLPSNKLVSLKDELNILNRKIQKNA